MLKLICGSILTLILVVGCIETPNSLREKINERREKQAEQRAINAEQSAAFAKDLSAQLASVTQACAVGVTSLDRALCSASEQMRVANEMGAPTWMRAIIAESAERNIYYAKEVDAGRMTQQEAATRSQIDSERIKNTKVNEEKSRINKLQTEMLKQLDDPFLLDNNPTSTTTNCQPFLDGIRCKSF